MNSSFKGFYSLSIEEFSELWKDASFVLDTNVLLNLYRYQKATRDALLNVLEQVSDRIWIPYQVALEYQRNRLKVIGEQQQRFTEVGGLVNKLTTNIESEFGKLQLESRHSYIDPKEFLNDLRNLTTGFTEKLKEQSQSSISVNSKDDIREKLDSLLLGKIGPPPESQCALNEIVADGEQRYKARIPPGFNDISKDDGESEEFTYGGLTYKRKYGDLVVWKQIIDYTQTENVKNIIFVTDDGKDDWWYKVKSNGPKTIGPRPELVDEIARLGNVEKFYMYNSEGFLRRAKEELDAEVTELAIEEVGEVAEDLRYSASKNVRQNDTQGKYEHSSLSNEGSATFDYTNNNGLFVFGSGKFVFGTKWSTGGDRAIHAYSDDSSISWLALAPNKKLENVEGFETYNHSSRARLAEVGDSVIWKNVNGNFLVTEIVDVKARGQKWVGHSVTLRYSILQ